MDHSDQKTIIKSLAQHDPLSSAKNAIEKLKQHASSPLLRKGASDDDHDLYFDPICGFHISTPPVIASILEEYCSIVSESSVLESSYSLLVLDFINGLILCYQEEIQSLWNNSRRVRRENEDYEVVDLKDSLPVLEYYELLLHLLLSKCMDEEKSGDSSRLEKNLSQNIQDDILVLKSIHMICQDIVQLTTYVDNVMIQERFIPVSLRCLTHFVTFLYRGYHTTTYDMTDKELEAITFAFITALSLSYNELEVTDILPYIFGDEVKTFICPNSHNLSLNALFNTCIVPPPHFDDNLVRSSHFYDLFGLKKQRMILNSLSVIRRTSLNLLKIIGRKYKGNNTEITLTVRDSEYLARVARSFFFGRSFMDQTGSKPYQFASNVPEESPWRRSPCRVHGVARVIGMLLFPNVSSKVLDDVLPVIYTLIDECPIHHKIIGASCFIWICQQGTNTELVTRCQLAEQVLSIGCRGCREATVFSLLALCRYELIRVCICRENIYVDARKTIINLLQAIRICHDTHPDVALASLAGGVAPLLCLAARQNSSELIEVVRHCLGCFLPILKSHSISYDFPLISGILSCLVSLMVGSFPIIGKEGGKIMAALLMCIGRCDRTIRTYLQDEKDVRSSNVNSQSTEVSFINEKGRFVTNLALHVASIALLLCGDSSSEVLLTAEDQCSKAFRKYCDKIRCLTEELRHSKFKI